MPTIGTGGWTAGGNTRGNRCRRTGTDGELGAADHERDRLWMREVLLAEPVADVVEQSHRFASGDRVSGVLVPRMADGPHVAGL